MLDKNNLEYTQNDDTTRTYRINSADVANLPVDVAGGSVAIVFDTGDILMLFEKTKEWKTL